MNKPHRRITYKALSSAVQDETAPDEFVEKLTDEYFDTVEYEEWLKSQRFGTIRLLMYRLLN